MDQKELEETAELARLNISKEELASALPAFEQMIGFFAVMDTFSTDKSPGAGAALVHSAHFRKDAPPDGADGGLGEALLDNAGERDGSFIVIPNVL